MSLFARYIRNTRSFPCVSSAFVHQARFHATVATPTQRSYALPCLEAPELGHAQHRGHVREVSQQLEKTGMLKIKLAFPDDKSEYLQQLLLSLNKHHKHQLPISHSSTRGWFWDVRPSKTSSQAGTHQAGTHQARSETMDDFPWHTDCSYEDPPPRYFALQVLQHDRFGGGTLSLMSVEQLNKFLSPSTQAALGTPEFHISIPTEFIKDPIKKHIISNILTTSSSTQSTAIRFREDIITPLTEQASRALNNLKEVLASKEVQMCSTVHLRAADLPKGSIILIDKRRWLHARNHINDPERHLRRVRWDSCSFGDTSESYV